MKRKKSSPTILERAIAAVPEFETVIKKLAQQVTLRGQSKSTLDNYTRRIALFVIHFNRLPEQVTEDEINEYLVALARDPKSPSRSSFKHMVYGLRYYYRLLGMSKKAIALPSLKQDTKLPVILNRSELKELFSTPLLLKQRIVLTLIYSAGLRRQEVINLKISDVDFERMNIHIRQSKYKKDRVVPLSPTMAIGLKKYLKAENPHIWLFNGKQPGSRYSIRGLSWVMRENLKKTSITKEVNLHTLRHTYATHLLEEGLRGEWKPLGKTGHYLYPVFQLSDTFQGKFLDSLKRKLKKKGMLEGFDKQVQKAWKTLWVINCEASMAGAEHVIRYLGQYTHRVAISNQRILDMTDTHVTFIAKDYRDRAIRKPVTLDGIEFLRRFCLHVFPKRFVRIRRYGIYNPTTIRNLDLQFIPEKKPDIDQLANPVETNAERIKRLTGIDASLCPVCKKGRMRVIREIPGIRSPAAHLPTMLLSLLQ